jgi:hypothetical protein
VALCGPKGKPRLKPPFIEELFDHTFDFSENFSVEPSILLTDA